MSLRSCLFCRGTSDGSDAWGGPDPCLGRLPGVVFACCGHGEPTWIPWPGLIDVEEFVVTDEPTTYVTPVGGTPLYGQAARAWLQARAPRCP